MKRSLAWIHSDDLSRSLDGVTYLEVAARLRRSGWDVTLIANGPSGARPVRGIDVLCFPRSPVYALGHVAWHASVLRWLARHRPDVLLFHPESAPYVLGLYRLRGLLGLGRPRLVMDTRGFTRALVVRRPRLKTAVRRLYYRLAHAWANRCADGQTAISERLAQAVGIPPSRLLGVWPSGVDVARFAQAARARRWPADGEAVEFVYAGSFNPERNLVQLSQAALLASARGCRLRLTLIGDGSERPRLEALASAADGVVRVAPRVPHEEMPEALGRMHVGVLPFPDLEIFRVSSPLKVFEYLAAGLPVVATPLSSVRSAVGAGDHVFWAADATVDGLSRAMGDACAARARLPELGERAGRAAWAGDWDVSVRALQGALERLLATTPDTARPPSGHDAVAAR